MKVFAHIDHCYIWTKKGETFKPENTISAVKYGASSRLCGCFAAGQTGALLKTDGVTRKGHYVEILNQHPMTSASNKYTKILPGYEVRLLVYFIFQVLP